MYGNGLCEVVFHVPRAATDWPQVFYNIAGPF